MKTKLWYLCLMTLALLGGLAFSGCQKQRTYKIGISQCSTDDWRKKMNEEIMREAMFHEGVEVEIRSADDNNQKQMADLDYFMANGFDIIIVAPNEARALTPKIQEIYASGKPVIVFDRAIEGDTYTAYQGADNEEIGRMVAEYAGSLVKEPKILEIKGLAGSSPAEMRHDGFVRRASELGYAVLGEGFGNWNYQDAKPVADTLLRRHPDTNIIYAHNDRMAIAAKEVAMAQGRDDIKIIGIDAAPTIGIKAVDEGLIDGTFLYPTQGHQLVRTALAILQGKKYEHDLTLPTAAPVDATNAKFLLLQDKALREETSKISVLQARVDDVARQYSLQTTILYCTIVILVLMAAIIFLLMRSYWSSKRHRQQIEKRNSELARQRDELDELYRQLQEATGSKLTFFTNVSHDLRTPLTLIADPVERLATAPNLTPQQHTLMQLANKNVKRLQRLINQILDIRKYDSGQLKLTLTNIDLAAAMTEWMAPFADIAAKRHIKFFTDIDQRHPITLAIDIEKTERILFNLLSNAFKFTPENGSITVSLTTDQKDAIIRVADTGCGIPADHITHVFERFFKTDEINPNGSGIGLALSKVFIDMHGGTISVESQPGHGTTFTVTLPMKQVAAQHVDTRADVPASTCDIAEIAPVADAEVEIAEDTPTLLVIDDNPDICTLLRTTLTAEYTVIVASNGAQGIRLANRYVPDLIICDVMMPGMDGYQVCRALKGESMTSHIPVLLLTACSRDEQRIEGYACGADAYMSKPFDTTMLLARCKSLIANRKLIYQTQGAATATAAPTAAKGQTAPTPATPAPAQPVEDEFLAKFIAKVEAQMADTELSVESIAADMGLSRVQLYRKIKALTNYSAAEMIRNIRLQRAARMLKSTTQTVAEVAYAVGFSSPSYFGRCYKEYFKETPADTQNRTSKTR